MHIPDDPIETIDAPPPDPRDMVAFATERRERVIPIRTSDLVRRLTAAADLAPSERLAWERFSRLLASLLHHEFHSWVEELKDAYTPLDPDRDFVVLEGGTRDRTESSDEVFLQRLDTTLRRANFSALELSAVREAIESPNELGLNYAPNIELFEHLRVYVRGRTHVRRQYRNVGSMFRRKTVMLDAFQRMIVVLKFRPDQDLGEHARTDVIYMRLFKDVPFVDMEMHLPEQATRVRMRAIDKAQIASPLIVGLPLFAFKLLTASLLSPIALGGVLVAPISAGVRSFFGFRRAKQQHMHRMIRSLYYLTLANNGSVVSWVIDAAEDEEFKEVLLAFYHLWRAGEDAETWDRSQLDKHVEEWLHDVTGRDIDFDAGDAMRKLLRFGLVQERPNGLRSVPIERALQRLDEQWDDLFRYKSSESQSSAVVSKQARPKTS